MCISLSLKIVTKRNNLIRCHCTKIYIKIRSFSIFGITWNRLNEYDSLKSLIFQQPYQSGCISYFWVAMQKLPNRIHSWSQQVSLSIDSALHWYSPLHTQNTADSWPFSVVCLFRFYSHMWPFCLCKPTSLLYVRKY